MTLPATRGRQGLKEHSSFANFQEARVVHSDIGLSVDFSSKTIAGYIQVTVAAQGDGAQQLVLDTSGLDIHEVTHVDGATSKPAQYTLAPPVKVLGSKLTIELAQRLESGQRADIGIRFTTSPESSALQFLEPSQTSGKQHPYLFTQCQAIHARSFVPCQDCPVVKSTYTAAVQVPEPLTAVMSAVSLGQAPQDQSLRVHSKSNGASRVFRFQQEVPIPSYLLALAVGELESRQIGPISRIWSEPSMVDAGAYEFANTANFLAKAEEVAGPYVWGQYDLLLLPPSFPYGGMENPCLTFITPTLLAGDRSLDGVICHEIAHSWTGNLVTNSTWEHFWLNEGFTVFLERKTIGRLKGEKAFQFGAAQGYVDLVGAVNSFGEDHPFTALVPDLSGGIDPDDAFSKIPYEKGFYFLYYLQELVGGSVPFEKFLKDYLNEFKLRTLTSYEFRDFFMKYFESEPAVKQIDWETWLHAPGLPPVQNTYDTTLGDAALNLAKRWHTTDLMGVGSNGPQDATAGDLHGFEAEQTVLFLDKLAEYRTRQPLHKRTTRRMNELYNLHAARNAEIRCSWYKLCIDAGDDTVFPLAESFLQEQGRMKFLRPLYRALYKSSQGKQLAIDTFTAARNTYHPIAAKIVAVDLHLA